jgi:hypothetical protein
MGLTLLIAVLAAEPAPRVKAKGAPTTMVYLIAKRGYAVPTDE